MARVTIEDCLEKIDNAYDIVALASQCAKDIVNSTQHIVNFFQNFS